MIRRDLRLAPDSGDALWERFRSHCVGRRWLWTQRINSRRFSGTFWKSQLRPPAWQRLGNLSRADFSYKLSQFGVQFTAIKTEEKIQSICGRVKDDIQPRGVHNSSSFVHFVPCILDDVLYRGWHTIDAPSIDFLELYPEPLKLKCRRFQVVEERQILCMFGYRHGVAL